MKYESAILKRLIDTYGVVGNPRYISEIIKEFIVRGKECFPNLFTYQADWLAHIDEFGLTSDYVVSYTGQQIYAPHTKERPVKRAILKGSTKYRDIDTGEVLDAFEDGRNLELVSVKMPVLTTVGKNLFNNKLKLANIDTGGNEFPSTVHISSVDYIAIKPNTQYYFSCADGFNATSAKCIFWYDGNKKYINHVNGTGTSPSNARYCRLRTRKDDSTVILESEFESVKMQLEEGSTATSYEPHKSNILTTPSDLELRGVGDVKDELDCLTGEYVQHIKEDVIDGNRDKSFGMSDVNDTTLVRFNINNVAGVQTGKTNKILCSSLPYLYIHDLSGGSATVSQECISNHSKDENVINIIIKRSRLSSVSLEGFRAFLQSNPITIQYPIATPTVKTVDLTILDQNGRNVKQLMSFNGGTHFTTSSQEGSLLPTLSVDVVTDLEETLNLCSLDGNTM